jgi:ribonuclease D
MSTVKESLEYLSQLDEIGVDTETKGFDPYTKEVLSLQLGDDKKQFVIDATTVDIRVYKELLETKLVILQNAKFDLRFLYHYRIVPKRIYDTFLVERILTAGIDTARRGLDALVYKYCKQTIDKTIRGNIHREGLSTRVIRYAADDVKYLGEIKRKQQEKLKEFGMLKC